MNNKNIKLLVIVLITFLALIIFSTNSNAASFSASISKTTVTVGDTFTVTVSANNAAGMYSVSSSNSNASVSSGSTSEFLENSSASITYKANSAGTVTITAKATDMTDLDDDTKNVTGSKSFTVTIKEKENSSNTSNSNSGSSSSNSGSSSGGSSSTTPKFTSVNETVYAKEEVNVRKSWSTSSTLLGTLKKGESVKRIGKGNNGWDKVTFNGQTAYIKSSYLTTSKPTEEEKSNDSTLKELIIDEGTISPEFNKDIKEYTINIPNEVTQLNIKATPTDSKATCEIKGNEDLQEGENTITIVVKAEDGSTSEYVIKATKAKPELHLNSISVTYKNQDGEIIEVLLNPSFSFDVYDYKIEDLKYWVESLNIQAEANIEEAIIEIQGNNNLISGENQIKIILRVPNNEENSTENEEIKTYTITFNKEEKPAEPSLIAKIKNWFKGMFGTVSNWYNQNFINITLGALGVSIVALLELSVYIVIDYKKYNRLLKKLKILSDINEQKIVQDNKTNTDENKNI